MSGFVQTNRKTKLKDINIKKQGTLIKLNGDIAHDPTFIMNGIDMCKKFNITEITIDIDENHIAQINIQMLLEAPCSISIKDSENAFDQRYSENCNIMLLNCEKVTKAHIELIHDKKNVIECIKHDETELSE